VIRDFLWHHEDDDANDRDSPRRSGTQVARAPHIQPKPARRARQSHDNAVAMRAAKYCAHWPAVELRPADVTGGAAATAADSRSGHLEREDLTQEARGGVSVEGKSGVILSHVP